MTGAECSPLPALAGVSEREQRTDRFVELLECLADLLVETAALRQDISASYDGDDSRVREAVERLAHLERSFAAVSTEATSVHHLLQQIRLI